MKVNRFTKRTIKCFLPSKFIENITYYKNYHKLINWNNPHTLDEKLMYLKALVYKNDATIKQCTDKYRVREYVKRKGCEEILIPLYDVREKVEELSWEVYPIPFMLKCNHGCGYNILITEENRIKVKEHEDLLNKWLKQDYALLSGEYHYRKIPAKILVEKFIGINNRTWPIDYKFFCSRGMILCVLIIFGRGGKQERLFVDDEFNFLDYTAESKYSGKSYKEEKPVHWSEMVEYAKMLSEDFPFVRVDLYDTDRVYFGELTFSPHGCIHSYMYQKAQLEIGKKINF